MNKHYSDCPIKNYNICTCNMSGEEIALVNWKIAEQEGKLPWWNFVARLSIKGSPPIIKKMLAAER